MAITANTAAMTIPVPRMLPMSSVKDRLGGCLTLGVGERLEDPALDQPDGEAGQKQRHHCAEGDPADHGEAANRHEYRSQHQKDGDHDQQPNEPVEGPYRRLVPGEGVGVHHRDLTEVRR